MDDNIVLQAVLDDPYILRWVVTAPLKNGERNPLADHPMMWMEIEAFENIDRQAHGRRLFARASGARHAYYRKFTTTEERAALRLEHTYLKYSQLFKGWRLYDEIARVMTVKFKKAFSWQEVKSMINDASEVIADIERSSNRKGEIAA